MEQVTKALTEALEDLTRRRPSPMEIKSLASNISAALDSEIECRVNKVLAQRVEDDLK